MKKRYWYIVGFDGMEKIFETKIAIGCCSEARIKSLLKTLVAQAGLDLDEIVGAYAKRGTRIANSLLDVRRDGQGPSFTCGTNPHFTARVLVDDL